MNRIKMVTVAFQGLKRQHRPRHLCAEATLKCSQGLYETFVKSKDREVFKKTKKLGF